MSAEVADIPVINLRHENAAADLLQAAITYGFIFVEHDSLDLPAQDVQAMFDISRDLFAAPEAVKATCSIHSSESGKNHGWLGMHRETLDPAHQKKGDFKEAFNIGEYVHAAPCQPFPEPLQPHAKFIGDFSRHCHVICNQIMRLLALALKIPEDESGPDWFAKRHDQSKGASGSILRLLYYPQLPLENTVNPAEDVRAGAHSDYGSVTLLFRQPGQPGLEILTPQNTWAAVPVMPAKTTPHGRLPVLVNIGDLLSYWTAGMLRSTVHRVVFPPSGSAEDRYSIAYFCHPEDDAQLVEIPSPLVKEYRMLHADAQSKADQVDHVLTAREHLNSRLAITYGISA